MEFEEKPGNAFFGIKNDFIIAFYVVLNLITYF